jgi:hypothetical protein
MKKLLSTLAAVLAPSLIAAVTTVPSAEKAYTGYTSPDPTDSIIYLDAAIDEHGIGGTGMLFTGTVGGNAVQVLRRETVW